MVIFFRHTGASASGSQGNARASKGEGGGASLCIRLGDENS